MRTAALAVALMFGSGCAHVEELPDGSRRVTGIVRMTVPGMPAEARGADMLEVQAVGVLMLSSPAGNSVSLGYSSERITALRNDARVQHHQ
jgi:hypothetical protein